jgi:hypothetical protein
VETTAIQPATSWLQSKQSPAVIEDPSEVTARPSPRRTGEAKSANESIDDDPLQLIASLSAEQRQRLASKQEGGDEVRSIPAEPCEMPV